MKYIEFKVHASGIGIEMITEILLRYGIDSVAIDDPGDADDILNKKHEYDWDDYDERIKSRLDREAQYFRICRRQRGEPRLGSKSENRNYET